MAQFPKLDDLVAQLPELYQPLFGHPEFDSRANRNVTDRIVSILKAYEALSKHLGRPLRVLDLGCAQGWFSFNLAKAGAQVVGLDLIEANINVCNFLVLENLQLNARFKPFEIEKVPSAIPEGQFDLMLGLSVFHHLCFHQGKEYTRDLMRALFAKIPSGIFEFALSSEKTDLATALSDDPEFLIQDVPFRYSLGWHPHFAGTRPLYFCSTHYKYEELPASHR